MLCSTYRTCSDFSLAHILWAVNWQWFVQLSGPSDVIRKMLSSCVPATLQHKPVIKIQETEYTIYIKKYKWRHGWLVCHRQAFQYQMCIENERVVKYEYNMKTPILMYNVQNSDTSCRSITYDHRMCTRLGSSLDQTQRLRMRETWLGSNAVPFEPGRPSVAKAFYSDDAHRHLVSHKCSWLSQDFSRPRPILPAQFVPANKVMNRNILYQCLTDLTDWPSLSIL